MHRLLLCASLLACWLGTLEPLKADEQVDYLRQIKPLLARRCFSCHGALKQESSLRLDTAALMRKGGESGAIIVAGKAAKSLLIERVTTKDVELRMPQEGEPLDDKEIALLKAWINQGAKAPTDEKPQADPRQHWAYKIPVRPQVPKPKNAEWVGNPIDTFIARQHARRRLTPQRPAPKRVLLRRVYLDLIGLPPTPQELNAFLADNSNGAYEDVVKKLLDSPHYGERWGRHWMDVWRYSDWYGYQAEVRNSARHIWRWRDWIIESLNNDKPYKQMILEMVAADEVDPTNQAALRATGFLTRHYYKFNRNTWLEATIEHTSKAFLGITMNCARCHDHMYDPISQKEYYQFRAIFEPYQVRTDRVPGQADVTKDGLSFAYDAHVDKKTYLFKRGNDKYPDKDNPLAAAIPGLFDSGKFVIQPIQLPAAAYYPGLRAHVQDETLAAAKVGVAAKQEFAKKARQTLAKAKKRLAEVGDKQTKKSPKNAAEAKIDVKEAETGVAVAEKQIIAARANLAAIEGRIAADKAKYANPPAPNLKQLARAASGAQRNFSLRKAEADVAQAEFDAARAKRAVEGGNKSKKKVVNDANKRLAAAKKKLETAKKRLGKVDENYAPLTKLYPRTSTGRRLALARWIADEKNPLAARVAVNHIWMRHFGKPLVTSVFDFGMNGKPPTHPELLDWLAVEFMKNKWSMKNLHRLMVLSNTYRMHSVADPANRENVRLDPDNQFVWRMNSRRMEAEIVRDSVLSVSGQLDLKMGGPELDSKSGLTTFRRSIYYRHAPEKFMTFMKLFDAASTHECYRRDETVVPQQALALVNSRLAIEQSRRLAARLNQQVGAEQTPQVTAKFIATAFRRVLCRPPTDDERIVCRDFLKDQTKRLADPKKLTTFAAGPKLSVKPAGDAGLRARENLVHVLLNHNEFVTIR